MDSLLTMVQGVTGAQAFRELATASSYVNAGVVAQNVGLLVGALFWGFGADILGDAEAANRQGAALIVLARWYSPAEVLRMATADNGELMALSGFINPYPGRLGIVEEGALADLLLVDGNPLDNLELVADPDRNFRVIMKDGRIYKNVLPK